MRTAILAALALHADTRGMTTYSRRKRWLADTKLDRGDRTAERRIEGAQRLLAQEIAAELERRRGGPGGADDGWYIDHFSAVLMLDGDAPEAIERRRIVAPGPSWPSSQSCSTPPGESGQRRLGIEADVTNGGTLVRAEELSRNRTRYLIRLPRPLQPDEAHEYAMRIRVAPDEPMRDYYVFRPERRCDGFDLRVRFDRGRPPAWVRQVTGEDVHVYYPDEDAPAPADRIQVDATGEATATFPQLRPRAPTRPYFRPGSRAARVPNPTWAPWAPSVAASAPSSTRPSGLRITARSARRAQKILEAFVLGEEIYAIRARNFQDLPCTIVVGR